MNCFTKATAFSSVRSAFRVRDSTRQYEGVEVVDGRVSDGLIDGRLLRGGEVVERLHLARLRAEQNGLVARLTHGLPGLGELDPLDPLGGHQKCDLAVGHHILLSGLGTSGRY